MILYRLFFLIIPICIVIYFCVTDPPYNTTYKVKGWFGQYIYENLTSEVYFMPENGKNPIKTLQKNVQINGLQFDEKFSVGLFDKEALYVKHDNVSLPNFIAKWPDYNLTQNSDGFDLSIPNNDQKADILYIFGKCEESHCIKSISGFDNVSYFTDYSVLFKYSPFSAPFNISVKSTGKVRFEIDFMWFEKSDLLKEFESKFPLYVIDFDKSYRVGGTILSKKLNF